MACASCALALGLSAAGRGEGASGQRPQLRLAVLAIGAREPERRCLVPVTRSQEWSVESDLATGKKRPHWFTVPSRPIFTSAGVWRLTEAGPAFAFLTCGYDGDPAAHIFGAIHPKAVPVILHDEDYDRWLGAPIEDACLMKMSVFLRRRTAADDPQNRRQREGTDRKNAGRDGPS